MSESFLEILTRQIEDAIADEDPSLVPLATPTTQLSQDLADLRQATNALVNASDLTAWVAALETWRQKVNQLAQAAFATAGAEADTLFTRFLQSRFPRVAAILSVAGVIVIEDGAAVVDWSAFESFIEDPANLINEQLWQALFDDVGAGGAGPAPGSAHLLALIVALIVMAPRTVTALKKGTLGVGALPAPDTRATTGPWHDFRQASGQWLSLTFAIGDPTKSTNQRTPQTMFDTVSDIAPDFSATLALRSDRRSTAATTITDFELWLVLSEDSDEWPTPLGSGWSISVKPGIGFGFGYDGSWHGAFRPATAGSPRVPAAGDPVVVSLGRDLPAGAPDIQLGPPYDTHVTVKDLGAFLKVREGHPVFEVGGFIHGFSFVLSPRVFRTFGDNALPNWSALVFEFDLDLAYIEGEGVRLNFGSGFEFTWRPEHKFGNENLNLTFHALTLKIKMKGGGSPAFQIRAEFRTRLSATLGPVLIVINGAGAWVGYWNTGQKVEYWGLLPPTGAGLQITAQGVTGGGFFNYDEGPPEVYSGALALKVAGSFDVSAFGIYQKTAAGNVSLVVVLGIRFTPGIQVGYGIAISGFGGLLGLNRRADTDALRLRLVSGAAGSLLFPDDPIKNAPAILDDLAAFLPAADGVFVVGPTAQLTWLKAGGFTLVSVSVGIFIELSPGLSKIILVGVLKAAIQGSSDPKDTLLQLRLDIMGVLDFRKKTLEFDATLVESQLLQVFIITGDAAFRASWGDQPYLALTVGGFHPDFNPAPMQFPQLERIAMTYGATSNSSITLRCEAYFAITTNTLQFGTRAEIKIDLKGVLNAYGFMQLDVLIQFTPFYFTAAIEVGVAIRVKSISLAGVKLRGDITGPGPTVISGKISFEVLFFEFSWHGSFTIGEAAAAVAAVAASVVQALQSELQSTSNLSAQDGSDRQAVQRQAVSDTYAVVSPVGRLAWSQQRVPLDTLLDRFEGAPLPAQQSVHLQVAGATESVREWFSPGSFATLTQSEALNRASFDRLPGGVAFGFGMGASGGVSHTVQTVTFRLPQPTPAASTPVTIPAIVLQGILGRTDSPSVANRTSKVTVARERWAVSDTSGTRLADGLSETEAHQRARQKNGVAVPAADVLDIGTV
jgi:hypothetical protein